MNKQTAYNKVLDAINAYLDVNLNNDKVLFLLALQEFIEHKLKIAMESYYK